jgi:alkyl hydroperoxide reductase subunit AhpC
LIFYFTNGKSFAQGVGTQAPDFTHETLDHGQISLSDHVGKVLYLFFFGWG